MIKGEYPGLKRKINEVFIVEPNNLENRWLTSFFKIITLRLKTMPFLLIVPLSLLLVIVLYLIFGHLIVRLASLLQYGF